MHFLRNQAMLNGIRHNDIKNNPSVSKHVESVDIARYPNWLSLDFIRVDSQRELRRANKGRYLLDKELSKLESRRIFA